MLTFGNDLVPGANWVEIVSIRKKDGSPLEEDNWRKRMFGRITLCWIAGGLYKRGAFFLFAIRSEQGRIRDVNLHRMTWCSTTEAHPVEIEPGIFDFETQTSIYRFRVLSDEEESLILDAVGDAMQQETEECLELIEGMPTGPAS